MKKLQKKNKSLTDKLNITEKQVNLINDDLNKNLDNNKNKTIKRIIIISLVTFMCLILIKIIDDYTGWGNAERVIKKYMDMADKSFVYKKYENAITIYKKILERWGKKTEYGDYIKQAKLNLAKVYKEANENEQALKLFNELLEEYKQNNKDMYAWLLLELGETYNNMYNTDEAIKSYQIIINEFSDTDWAAEAIFGIADSYKIAGKDDMAIKYYQQIVNKYKKGFLSAEALTNIGQIYEKQGKIKKALEVYKTIINDYPEIVTEYARLRYDTLNKK